MTNSRETSRYLPLVKSIVAQIKAKLPFSVDTIDLMQSGTVALQQAAHDYRTRQGATFRTFAYYSIRNAILDKLDEFASPSREYRAEHTFRKKSNELMQTLCISAENVVKRSLEEEVLDLKHLMQDLVIVYILSGGERLSTETLEERDRQFVDLYYDENLSLVSAAERLKLSKPEASRLHSKILERIRVALLAA